MGACRGLVCLVVARWLLREAPGAFLRPAAPVPHPQPTAAAGPGWAPPQALLPAALALLAGGAGAAAPAAAAGAAAVAATVAVPEAAIAPTDAVVQAFLLTFVSEIGDKTFFIAAILAAGGTGEGQGQNQKLLTFAGAIAALAVMTMLAVGLGQVFHAVPDAGGIPIDDIASTLAFGFFGIKLLTDAWQMKDDGSLLDEKEEAEEAVKSAALPAWMSGGTASLVLPPLVLQAFVLVFAAEIGDRSFITAAALSAQGGPAGAAAVFLGGITAHAFATTLAVLLGEVISKYITEKQLAYIGGVLFLIFAASSTVKLLGVLAPA